ncbi:MAG: SDR family NAD(P)-dependent oxidoreductase [Myxococcota bacterium]
MQKTLLVTGATDGIGLETAKRLAARGHDVVLHGRNPAKLERAAEAVAAVTDGGRVERYAADLSRLAEVETLAEAIAARAGGIDVLINNAGVFRVAEPRTEDGLDVRFAVNAIAPYALTRRLLPVLGVTGRVVNLSSAAQAPVDARALTGARALADDAAYAQSKLALTMWSRSLATSLGDRGPVIVAVNPGSFLASKMVEEAYGVAGSDLGIGAEILCEAALSDSFANASGRYYDNDAGRFASPHPDATDPTRNDAIVELIERVLERSQRGENE